MSIAITFLQWLGFVVAAIGVFMAVSVLFGLLWGATFGRAAATDLPKRYPPPKRHPDQVWHGPAKADTYWHIVDSPNRPENDPAFWHLHRAHMDAGLTFGEAHAAAVEEYVPGARRVPLTSWSHDPHTRYSTDPYLIGEYPIIKPGFDQ